MREGRAGQGRAEEEEGLQAAREVGAGGSFRQEVLMDGRYLLAGGPGPGRVE